MIHALLPCCESSPRAAWLQVCMLPSIQRTRHGTRPLAAPHPAGAAAHSCAGVNAVKPDRGPGPSLRAAKQPVPRCACPCLKLMHRSASRARCQAISAGSHASSAPSGVKLARGPVLRVVCRTLARFAPLLNCNSGGAGAAQHSTAVCVNYGGLCFFNLVIGRHMLFDQRKAVDIFSQDYP